VTKERFETAYQADLANGIGNLCSRVAAMVEKENFEVEIEKLEIRQEILKKINEYNFSEAMDLIWHEIKNADMFINKKEIWKLSGEEKRTDLTRLVKTIRQIGTDLQVLLPETAEKIRNMFQKTNIKKGEPLFIRLA